MWYAQSFNDFIINNELVDVQTGGKRFIKIESTCMKMTKFDRFLVFKQSIDLFPSMDTIVLNSVWSDFCSIFLTNKVMY